MEKSKDFGQGEAAIRARENASGNWMPLVNWGWVYPGNRGVNRQGLYDLYDAPVGVRMTVEEGVKSEPLLVAQEDWEGNGTLEPMRMWQAEGKYHLLYYAHPGSQNPAAGLGGTPEEQQQRGGMGYAVSEDAYHWVRPNLGQVEFAGSRDNNKLADAPTGSPFIDPQAPAAERFKAIGQEGGCFDPDTGQPLPQAEAYRRMKAMEYEGPAYKGPKMAGRHWISGWVSPDGLHWKKREKPLANMPADSGNAAHWDEGRQEYFAYLRMGGMGRRAIGLSRTKDFWHWPEGTLVYTPDPQDEPDVSFYAGDVFEYPGRKDLWGMFLQIYHQVTDHCDMQIAFSHDGLYWHRPERKVVIPVGRPGDGDECQVRSWGGLYELPDGYWGTMYRGESWLHNSRGLMPVGGGQIRWARWRPHRFCGIEAAGEGKFSISTVKREKNELRLNYRCSPAGWIAVELIRNIPSRLHPDADPIPGFSFEESERLTGDNLDAPVRWSGKSDLSGVDEVVAIRVRMFQAKLFAFSI